MRMNNVEKNNRDHRDGHSITIRRATIDDATALARVHVDTWRTTYRGMVPDDYLASLSYEKRTARCTEQIQATLAGNFEIIVAENEDGQIVGFVDGGPNREDDPIYKGELYAIYILQAYQGRGIGKRLVPPLAKSLMAMGLDTMLLWVLTENTLARRFYESLGGRYVRTSMWEVGGVSIEEVAYGWLDIRSLLKEHAQ
jgi:ribosomal protein S18 acetylase RimI-like enzyme